MAFKLVNSKSAKHSIVWLACVLLSAPAFGQSGDAGEPTSYDAEQIRRLIMRSGAGELGVQLLSIVEQQIIATLLEANPELPSEAGPIVRATVGEVLGGDISGLVTRMIPSYAAAFSPEEVDALVAFYDSPAGSKLRAQLPTLMRASMGEGQRWVNEHRADLDALLKRRLDTAGIDLPD